MLRRLSVTNFAIIDHVELHFDAGLTVITGETGAGKSIILGAMDLILGERGSTDLLRNEERKCVVEGSFNIESIIPRSFFTDNEIDYEPETILRREIAQGGRSRAFINDTPVNLGVLRALTRQLVDIHRPYQTRDLAESRFQADMLDALCNHADLLTTYRVNLKRYTESVHEISRLEKQQQDVLKEQDYLRFQYNELAQADLKQGEQELLEAEFKTLEHAAEIKIQLTAVYSLIQSGDYNALENIKEANRQLQHISKLTDASNDIQLRLNALSLELQDIADETERLNDTIQVDPERLQQVQERLDLLYKLQKKHHAASIDVLNELKFSLQNQLNNLTYQSQHLDELRIEKVALEKEMQVQCKQITKNREHTAKAFEEKVNAMLPDVGMPQARLSITIQSASAFTYDGHDIIEFLFSANKGGTPRPVADVASVGEMSRLMLCIKSVVGTHMHLPTMFFDEIDTGISGQTAISVGQLLHNLSATQQIITITHLPQIAARGQSHYFVFKEDDAKHTYTRVRHLDANERVLAIAQMLSGATPTPAAMKNAKELLG